MGQWLAAGPLSKQRIKYIWLTQAHIHQGSDPGPQTCHCHLHSQVEGTVCQWLEHRSSHRTACFHTQTHSLLFWGTGESQLTSLCLFFYMKDSRSTNPQAELAIIFMPRQPGKPLRIHSLSPSHNLCSLCSSAQAVVLDRQTDQVPPQQALTSGVTAETWPGLSILCPGLCDL